jgi:gas vesicle protein
MVISSKISEVSFLSKGTYIFSAIIGGVIGAAGMYFLTTENGVKVRNQVTKKIQQADGARIMDILVEIGNDWAEFGDVVKVKTRSTKNVTTLNE